MSTTSYEPPEDWGVLETWGSRPQGGDPTVEDTIETINQGGGLTDDGTVTFGGDDGETPGFWESLITGENPLEEDSQVAGDVDDLAIEIVDFSEAGWSDADLEAATPDSAGESVARSVDGLTFNAFDLSEQDPEAPDIDPSDWLPDNWKLWAGGIGLLVALIALRPYADLGAEVAG